MATLRRRSGCPPRSAAAGIQCRNPGRRGTGSGGSLRRPIRTQPVWLDITCLLMPTGRLVPLVVRLMGATTATLVGDGADWRFLGGRAGGLNGKDRNKRQINKSSSVWFQLLLGSGSDIGAPHDVSGTPAGVRSPGLSSGSSQNAQQCPLLASRAIKPRSPISVEQGNI